jgi:nitrite reductase/ring-hydroxylating ferredoxin subunit
VAALAAAPALDANEFLELEAAISLPLRDLTEPWAAVRFRAFCPLPAPPPGGPPHRLLRGMAIRLPGTDDAPSRIEALCLTCPHEICEVDLRSDVDHRDHPVLVCACHFSVFDPVRRGERLAGRAPRGLYRFRSWVEEDCLVVAEVEAAALRAPPAPSSAPRASD